ncbi:MAG: glucosaminidase domain-containing protein [Selenomonadaceae bacterium]|nr:glucosaminidase domain-containing protein [Selenomonadaceae bacterium]
MKKFFKLVFTILFVIVAIGCKNTEAVNSNEFQLEDAGAKDIPKIILRENPNDITIFGEPVATQEQMVKFILLRNPNPKINCSVEDLVRYYYEEGAVEGIRPDIALCQAIKETGTWNYGGDVTPDQNNYCGLGTTGGGVKGGYFATPQIGARAHIQHLLVYTSTRPTKLENVDPRYDHIVNNRRDVYGNIHTWTGLNGVWASPGHNYGQDILALWQQAQAMYSSGATVQINREGDTPEERAANLVRSGLIYYGNKDFVKAEEEFQAAVDILPYNADALWDLALAQEKNGKLDAAIATYDRLLQFKEGFETGYYNRGRLKLMKNDFDGAIKDFKRTLQIENRFADAQNEIAVAHFKMGLYDEALKDLEIATKINTTNNIVNSNYAKLKAYLGK